MDSPPAAPPIAPRRPPTWSRQVLGHRYDFHRQGSVAVLVFSLLFALVAVLYLYAHRRYPPAEDAGRVGELVSLGADGIVSITSPEDIDWYVGEAKAVPLLAAMNSRNEQIVALRGEVRELGRRARLEGVPGGGEELGRLLAEIEQGTLWRPAPTESAKPPAKCASPDGSPKSPPTCACAGARPAAPSPPDWTKLGALLEQLGATTTALRELQAGRLGALGELDRLLHDLRALAVYRSAQPERLVAVLDEIAAALAPLRPPAPDAALAAPPAPPARPDAVLAAHLADLAGELAAVRGLLDARLDPLLRLERHLARLGGDAVVGAELRTKVARWTHLRTEQAAAVANLRPPVRMTLFWVSPSRMVIEILFWSCFGVLTNLLLNTAEATRAGRFRPRELIVALSKLLYGPVVSFMLCVAIITQFVSYDARAWTMPLIAFLLGYNARKSANLVDWLSSKLLDRFREAAERDPEQVARSRAAQLEKYLRLIKPASVTELRATAKRLAEDATLTTVLAKESRINPAQS